MSQRTITPSQTWIFPANVPQPTDVYDGDTIRADIDLGLRTYRLSVKLRLARVNTPELRGPTNARARQVRDYVRTLLVGRTCLIRFVWPEPIKYGRFLAEIWFQRHDDPDTFDNLADHLLDRKMAEPYAGATH